MSRTAWVPLVVLPVAVFAIGRAWEPWVVMWALSLAVFAGCKWLTYAAAREARSASRWSRQLGYLVAWPGLDAREFLAGAPPVRPKADEWIGAAISLVAGVVLVLLVAPAVEMPLARGWTGMVGLILALHFGSFALLSCAWRAAGVNASPLMQRPLLARGLADFWSRRWNTAFRDLVHGHLFALLARRLRPPSALFAAFLASGIVHDLVISLPARGGYGLPTLYFVLQGGGLLLERSRLGRKFGWKRSRLLLVLVTALPAPLLFHPPFVERVIVPFLRVLQP